MIELFAFGPNGTAPAYDLAIMSNKQWLKELADTQKFVGVLAPLGLDGVHRLETHRTIYVFRDGVCVDVGRRVCDDDSSSESTMIGMRVVSWLIDVEGQRRMFDRWLPGARAVLFRAGKIALTSPSFGFVACSQIEEEEMDDDQRVTAEYTPAPQHASSTGSFTRIFPQ